MKTLAFDPGITTGWAIVEEDGQCRASGIIHSGARVTEEVRTLLALAQLDGEAVALVVEEVPRTGGMGMLARELEAVRRHLLLGLVGHEYEVTFIMPGTWKPQRPSVETKLGRTVHERDAIGMARYHQWKARS